VPRIALVGAGRMGTLHAERIAALGAGKVCLVVDRDPARAELLAGRYGAVARATLGELGNVDGVIIASPPKSHPSIAERCLEQGLAVLVEKPLAPTLVDARRLWETALRSGGILRVGHSERFCPAYRSARPLLVSATHFVCERLVARRAPNATLDPLFDLMIHDLDILFDVTSSRVGRVVSADVDEANGACTVRATVQYRNGRTADLTAGYVAVGARRRLVAHAGPSAIELDWVKRSVAALEPRGPRLVFSADSPSADVIGREQAEFFDALVRGSPSVDGVEAAVAAVEHAEMIRAQLSRA
ncbi:MAG TPA: Gfo/Idh/MocA family oxidoreductase, partial [Polyangiaceae bacterium]